MERREKINAWLSHLRFIIYRGRLVKLPADFYRRYRQTLARLRQGVGDWSVYREITYDVGSHPETSLDYECAFATRQVRSLAPRDILDIGSYRHFIIGLLACHDLTTVDVRSRRGIVPQERVIVCDAKALTLPDASFDMVISLCALEHFGLGRYGDQIDLEGDRKALAEMMRVLRPGGHLVMTIPVHAGRPAIAFNSHRVYTPELIKEMFAPLELVEEEVCDRRQERLKDPRLITADPQDWDVYMGCWRKP